MVNTLIGNVKITPSTPRPSEPFRVEVFDTNQNSYAGQVGPTVFMDGVPGAPQTLQASRPGNRPLLIRVKSGDISEIQRIQVKISGDPWTFRNRKGQREPALLSVRQVMSSPYEVAFRLGRRASRKRPLRMRAHHQATLLTNLEEVLEGPHKTGRPLARAILTSDNVNRLTSRKSILKKPKLVSKAEVTTAVMDLGDIEMGDLLQAGQGKQPSFDWDFGDGTKKTTRSPYVTHDYSNALTAEGEILYFDVRCRAVLDNIEVTRTLVLHSAYVLCKNRGTIVPPVKADVYAHKHHASFYGMMEIANLEEEAISLTAQAVVPLTNNPDAKEQPIFRELDQPINLPPLSNNVIGVYPQYRSPKRASLVVLSTGLASSQTSASLPVTNRSHAKKAAAQPQASPAHSQNMSLLQQLQSEGDVPRDAPGFSVYFAGQTASGKPVRFTHVFEIHMAERNREPDFPQLDLPELSRRPWPWEEVMTTIDEILVQKQGLSERLNIAIEKNLGIIAVSADSRILEGKNTTLKKIAREISQAGLVPMQKLTPQFQVTLSQPDLPKNPTATIKKKVGPNLDRELSGLSNAAVKATASVDKWTAAKTPQGVKPVPVTVTLGASNGVTMYAKNGPPPPGPVSEGEICHPDNISDIDQALAEAQQLVCQLSGEKETVLMPGRFMNGRKGDVVLSPGGPGLIGSLLRAVDPPQKYSHSGIMTRNYDEVTHSTASEDRIYDYLVGTLSEGTDGIRPDILQWMWPGVVTQKVEDAVNGVDWNDPESGKPYSISSFSGHAVGVTHNDHFQIVPPLIVKPDPLLETSQVRQTLHAVSSTSRNDGAEIDDNGNLMRPYKSHYRLFCYTNPTIGQTDSAPASSLWAVGTYPSVCSSFVWLSLKKHNIHLEGDSEIVHPTDLEAEDVNQGAGVLPATKDGLYWYTAAERLAAGTWLYNEMHYKAYDEAGWFGDLLSDAADDVGNQMVNTFALDDAWGKDHDDWKQTQDTSAVSPDNILFWDGPEQNGLYGYSEPLIYREPRMEEYAVNRWKRVLSRGTITGRVFLNGQPVSGALVTIYDGKSDTTNANGQYYLSDVAFGSYVITASKVIAGIYYEVKINVSLNQETLVQDLYLEPPSDRYRLGQLYLDFYGREDEDFTSDETTNPGPEYYELELGPDRLTNHKHREYSWGGEARVEYDITILLLVDNSIQVNVNAVLFEGTSESTNDLDGTASISFNVPKDQTTAGYIKVVNTDEDEPDTYGELTLSLKNAQNNN